MVLVTRRASRAMLPGLAALLWNFAPDATALPRAKPPELIIRACVDGGVLTGAVAATETSPARRYAPRYRLAGPRALVKQIKRDHAGHLDEFTGTTSGDYGTGTGPSVDLGGLSVGVGVGPADRAGAARVPETPVFEVTSFRHTDVGCR